MTNTTFFRNARSQFYALPNDHFDKEILMAEGEKNEKTFYLSQVEHNSSP